MMVTDLKAMMTPYITQDELDSLIRYEHAVKAIVVALSFARAPFNEPIYESREECVEHAKELLEKAIANMLEEPTIPHREPEWV